MDREMLRMALIGYETQINDIAGKVKELKSQLGVIESGGGGGQKRRGRPPLSMGINAVTPIMTTVKVSKQRRHRITAEGRARIAEAQRKRWAAVKKAATKSSKTKTKSAGNGNGKKNGGTAAA